MSIDIKVFWMAGQDTFICGVNGDIDIDQLLVIEKDLRDNEMEWDYPEYTELLVHCSWSEAWDDYGTGYGDILHWPGYWDLTVRSLKNSEAVEFATTDNQQPQPKIPRSCYDCLFGQGAPLSCCTRGLVQGSVECAELLASAA